MNIAIEARPIKWSYGTGIGNYTYGMIERLNEIDVENQYWFLWPDAAPGEDIPFSRPYRFYQMPKDDDREAEEIPQWLAAEQIDLFHLPQNGFRAPRSQTSKIVVTIHDLIPYRLPEIVRPSFMRRFITEMPQIIERADGIISVSEASKRDIIDIFNVDPAKIAVIPSAPSPIFQRLPKETSRRLLAERHHILKNFILYVGGLNARKNVAELICAYAKIYRELPGLPQLVVVGAESKNRRKLELLAEALEVKNDVVFPGFVENTELPWFYNAADLFVYPSLYEGFGLPPLEAMACGTPVIVSNVSSLPEVAGDAALQVNPHDTLELAEAILMMLSNESFRCSYQEKGVHRSQLYTWTENARRILEVYRNVMNGAPIAKVVG